MQPFTLVFVTLTLSVARPAFAAGEIHVPGDYPSVQAAINAASAGDTIIVQLGSTGPLVIDKPLTIVGDPSLKLYSGSYPCISGTWEHPVTLAGPGSGSVALVNVVAVNYPVPDCDNPAPIVGTGFDELHIVSSNLQAPEVGLSGQGYGTPCIDVDVPTVFVVDSVVIGGNDDDHSAPCYGAFPPSLAGHPGIDNPTGTVIAMDSEVRGGDGGGAGGPSGAICLGGAPCPPPPGGSGVAGGGPGVVAQSLFASNSTIAGGIGSTLELYPGGPGAIKCGKDPDGAAAEVSQLVLLPGILQGSSTMHLGSTWSLTYLAIGPLATLFFSVSPSAPYYLTGAGWAFLQPGTVVNLGPVPTGLPQTLTFPILQMLDSGQGLTRPVASLILP